MSTEQNKQVIRRLIEESWNKGNLDVMDELISPDLVEHQFGLHPTIEGQKEDLRYLRRAFPDFHLTIEEVVAEGDKVWVRMSARGTNLGGFMGAPNGKRIEINVFDLCRFKDGKIIEHWGVPDRFAVLAQLGMLPKPQRQTA